MGTQRTGHFGSILMGFALGAAAGLIGGMFLFGGGPVDTASGTESAPIVEPDSASRQTPPEAPGSALETSIRNEAAATPIRERTAIPTPAADAIGDEVIEGRVTDPDGNPVAGATLRAQKSSEWQPTAARRGLAPEALRSLDEEVAQVVADYQRRTQSRQQTLSDSDGRYRFTGLAVGDYDLTAACEGFDLSTRGSTWRAIPTGSVVNWKAEPVTALPVSVRLASGQLAERAALQLKNLNSTQNRTNTELWTRADPTLRLAGGAYEITALIDAALAKSLGTEEQASPSQSVVIAAGQPLSPLVFELAPRVGIRGRVVVPDDQSISSLAISHLRIPDGGVADPESLTRTNSAIWAQPWNGFRFDIYDLPPGRYLVGAFDNHRNVGHAEVAVASGISEVAIHLDESDDDLLTVHATSPEGAPLPGVGFRLRSRVRNSSSSSSVTARIQATGEYRVALDDRSKDALSDADKGSVWLLAKHALYGEVPIQLASGQRELTVQFQSPALLNLTLTGYLGSGLESRIQVALSSLADPSNSDHWDSDNTKKPGPAGELAFDPVRPGDWRVELQLSQRAGWGNDALASQVITLARGDNHLTMAVPPVYSLTVRFAADDDSADAMLSPGSGRYRSTEIKEHVARFEDLAAGEYTVRAGHGRSQSMRVRVPAQSDVSFVAEPLNALRVNLQDPQGALAQAGLRDQDVVVAINGTTFEDEAGMMMAWSGAMAGKEVTLTVQRGATRVTCTLPAKTIAGGEGGGYLEPSSR